MKVRTGTPLPDAWSPQDVGYANRLVAEFLATFLGRDPSDEETAEIFEHVLMLLHINTRGRPN